MAGRVFFSCNRLGVGYIVDSDLGIDLQASDYRLSDFGFASYNCCHWAEVLI